MLIPKELKINRFKEVKIPEKCEYFKRLGLAEGQVGEYGGEDDLPPDENKLDNMVNSIKAYDKHMQEEANKEAEKDTKK